MRVSHEALREWLRENHIKLKDLGSVVGVQNVSYYTAQGKPFPIEWLLAWKVEYGWSDEQLFRYAFGRWK